MIKTPVYLLLYRHLCNQCISVTDSKIKIYEIEWRTRNKARMVGTLLNCYAKVVDLRGSRWNGACNTLKKGTRKVLTKIVRLRTICCYRKCIYSANFLNKQRPSCTLKCFEFTIKKADSVKRSRAVWLSISL